MQVEQRSAAQFFFEIGYGACFAEAYIRNGSKAPWPMSDTEVERAWEVAGEAHDDPEEFDRYLALAGEASLPPSAPVDRDAAIETMARAMLKPWVHRDFNDEELAGARKDATAAYDALAGLTPSVLAESTSNDCLLVAEGWQDIASAPKDPPYLTFTPGFGVGLCVRNLNEGVPQSATHWRPLPAPPAVTDLSGVGVG